MDLTTSHALFSGDYRPQTERGDYDTPLIEWTITEESHLVIPQSAMVRTEWVDQNTPSPRQQTTWWRDMSDEEQNKIEARYRDKGWECQVHHLDNTPFQVWAFNADFVWCVYDGPMGYYKMMTSADTMSGAKGYIEHVLLNIIPQSIGNLWNEGDPKNYLGYDWAMREIMRSFENPIAWFEGGASETRVKMILERALGEYYGRYAFRILMGEREAYVGADFERAIWRE